MTIRDQESPDPLELESFRQLDTTQLDQVLLGISDKDVLENDFRSLVQVDHRLALAIIGEANRAREQGTASDESFRRGAGMVLRAIMEMNASPKHDGVQPLDGIISPELQDALTEEVDILVDETLNSTKSLQSVFVGFAEELSDGVAISFAARFQRQNPELYQDLLQQYIDVHKDTTDTEALEARFIKTVNMLRIGAMVGRLSALQELATVSEIMPENVDEPLFLMPTDRPEAAAS